MNADVTAELGGGERPRYRPNFDVRAVPGVDVRCDVAFLPIRDGCVDFLYAAYVAEHVPWRRVPGFLSDCHRILREGGKAQFAVPNLKEQARLIASKEKMTMADVEMIFGSQEFEDDAGAHRSSMDPGLMEGLLKEAGFSKVDVAPHFMTITDMVVEAQK